MFEIETRSFKLARFVPKINVTTVERVLTIQQCQICGEPHRFIDLGCIYLFCSRSQFCSKY